FVRTHYSVFPSSQIEELDLPAGQENIRYDFYSVLKQPGKLMSFEPHMHSNGRRMCLEAVYPTGRQEMLSCARWNHNWGKVYFYEDDAAPLLPAGTILHAIAWFDNSAANPRTVDARNWKGYGNRTLDDMYGYFSDVVYMTEQEFRAELTARSG